MQAKLQKFPAIGHYPPSFPVPRPTLGERIKKMEARTRAFSEDLAKMLGVDEMTIVNWEKDIQASTG